MINKNDLYITDEDWKDILPALRGKVVKMARGFIEVGAAKMLEEDVSLCNRAVFEYVPIWSDNDGDMAEEKKMVELNNQTWLALREMRESPDKFEEREEIVVVCREYLELVGET